MKKVSIKSLRIFVLPFSLALLQTPSQAQMDSAPGQVVVKLKQGADVSLLARLNQQFSVSAIQEISPRPYSPAEVMEILKERQAAKAFVARLERRHQKMQQVSLTASSGRVYLLKLPAGVLPEAAARYAAHPAVQYAQPE